MSGKIKVGEVVERFFLASISAAFIVKLILFASEMLTSEDYSLRGIAGRGRVR